MSGILGGFVRKMKQRCVWSKFQSVDEWTRASWGDAREIPCIFFPERQVTNSSAGAVIETQAEFFLQSAYGVGIGDKIEYRGREYIVEKIMDIEWFGGIHDGYKCLCRQEGGVPV